MNVCVIVGDYPNINISYASPEIMRNLRDARHFLFFEDIDSIKVLDLPIAVMRQFKKPIEIGNCYYITDNDIVKAKSVLS